MAGSQVGKWQVGGYSISHGNFPSMPVCICISILSSGKMALANKQPNRKCHNSTFDNTFFFKSNQMLLAFSHKLLCEDEQEISRSVRYYIFRCTNLITFIWTTIQTECRWRRSDEARNQEVQSARTIRLIRLLFALFAIFVAGHLIV